MRIYVVDDAAVLRSLFARIVAALGHTIVASENGTLATLERVRELAPDVLIIDGRLSATDVVGFVRRARVELPMVRMLIVASLEEMALVTNAAEAGAAGVVRRPLTRGQIRSALRGA